MGTVPTSRWGICRWRRCRLSGAARARRGGDGRVGGVGAPAHRWASALHGPCGGGAYTQRMADAATATGLPAARQRRPAGLQQLIELQLEQLDAEAQQVLEVASVARSSRRRAWRPGCPLPLDAIAARCEGPAQRGQFIEDRGLAAWPDGTVSGRYSFRHALYQEVLYGRLGSGRRMRCHRAIGMRLEGAMGRRWRRSRRRWPCTLSAERP